jgi:CRISPR-associated protein Cas5t
MPKKAVTLRKLSRLKYGVPSKQSSLGNAPDFVESLCGIELLCWIDSSRENMEQRTLEERVTEAIEQPDKIERYGLLSLGLSDDMVNEVSLWNQGGQFAHAKKWQRLIPKERGSIELPVWVDHLGSSGTRWRRFDLDPEPVHLESQPGGPEWPLLSFSND